MMSRLPPALAEAAPTAGSPNARVLPGLARALEAVAFSSGLAAAIGAVLSLVASRVLGAPEPLRWALLTAAGAFCVYTIDRLRDVARDRATSPSRTLFVERHRRRLLLGVGLSGLVGGGCLVGAPARSVLLCLGIGALGLLHRRLKRLSMAKTLYVSLAWTAACAGLPWVAADFGPGLLPLAGALLPALIANLIASSLRDGEAPRLGGRPERVLGIARGAALVGVAIALASPAPMPALAWIPAAQLVALAGYRAEERYGHVAVDGALLVGGLASGLQLALVG